GWRFRYANTASEIPDNRIANSDIEYGGFPKPIGTEMKLNMQKNIPARITKILFCFSRPLFSAFFALYRTMIPESIHINKTQ
ncbi:MAG: hypothetical protein DRO95_06095, partial [Candidatus Altiarchaeales archaeon]